MCSLVWVRNEQALPGTSRKINAKWLESLKVVEVIRDGGEYLLENLSTG